ncbi:hypothetical protein E2C01_017608 [Portunus trituberculatus]|uniref:Uncharacterized protein n=1 Tax=Portunus trituberculatus TaxID=210409 RepID=A0A5B7DTC0_PORTR|nr:hypothetical protein [Portunus trituberculatus]
MASQASSGIRLKKIQSDKTLRRLCEVTQTFYRTLNSKEEEENYTPLSAVSTSTSTILVAGMKADPSHSPWPVTPHLGRSQSTRARNSLT